MNELDVYKKAFELACQYFTRFYQGNRINMGPYPPRQMITVEGTMKYFTDQANKELEKVSKVEK